MGQLVQLDESDLLNFENIGKVTVHRTKRKLAEHGLTLGMTGKDIDEFNQWLNG